MKRYISNSLDIYVLITGENEYYYICGQLLFAKNEVVKNYDPLDDMTDILHIHVVPFVNY